MKRIEYRTRDAEKSEWGPGPWMSEPDKVQFQDEATGLPCLIVRNQLGALCGYVGVTEDHPLFGCDYSACGELDVHGGVTFADVCQPHASGEDVGICHMPEPGEPDHVFWLGFDCAHGFDLVPKMDAQVRGWIADGTLAPRPPMPKGYRDTYRTLPYVVEQCANLARQLAAMAKP